jgi:hypothetical protein
MIYNPVIKLENFGIPDMIKKENLIGVKMLANVFVLLILN